MSKTTLVALAALAAPAAPATALAQHPLRHPADAVEIQFARSQPVAHYTLRVDTVDLSAFAVELRLRNVPDTFRLAMVAHPEYDDRYWRYVEDLRVAAAGGPGAVTRADSALWQVVAPGGEAVVRYRIRLPAARRGLLLTVLQGRADLVDPLAQAGQGVRRHGAEVAGREELREDSDQRPADRD